MTPSAILLTFCVSLFLALGGTFIAYFIMQSYKRRAMVAMRVSKRARYKEEELRIEPDAQPQYQLAKAK